MKTLFICTALLTSLFATQAEAATNCTCQVYRDDNHKPRWAVYGTLRNGQRMLLDYSAATFRTPDDALFNCEYYLKKSFPECR